MGSHWYSIKIIFLKILSTISIFVSFCVFRSQKTDSYNEGYVLELDCSSSLEQLTDQKTIPEFIKKVSAEVGISLDRFTGCEGIQIKTGQMHSRGLGGSCDLDLWETPSIYHTSLWLQLTME